MKIDFAKRRRVMERSQLLGHCICDVRRPCPCDMLIHQNICPCAGERPEPADLSRVKLMDFVHNAGCASKISPADLDAVLARLPEVTDPAVISGLAAADDAAIYRLTDEVCLVQTVDVFTPCVDDARLFGRICAANCLSDIYAMGGTPRTALSVLAFPSEKLPGELVYQVLAGAMEKFQEAGVALVGGHSVKDDEIKLGFAITGLIDPAVAAALEKPEAGDVLVLTKPLGTGVLTFARQIGREFPEGLKAAEISMAALNRAAAEAMREAGASACTDITGFGLFAHLRRMLRAGRSGSGLRGPDESGAACCNANTQSPIPARAVPSGGSPDGTGGSPVPPLVSVPVPPRGLGAEIFAEALPAFPGAVEALRQGVIPGAIERNREYVGDDLRADAGVDDALVHLGFDAQTSGGLLIAIRAERLADLQQSLAQRGVSAFVVGNIVGGAAGQVRVKAGPAEISKTDSSQNSPMKDPETKIAAHGEGCCADIFQNAAAQGSGAETQKAFGAFMRSVQAGGVLSEKAKELILFSLVVSSRCQPCFETHYRKARELGITPAELDEAAWCAIAMGGAPVKMFYQECRDKYCNSSGAVS
jgi:selenide,water dikinase